MAKVLLDGVVVDLDVPASPITERDVRNKRDGLIAATDWWATTDRTMTAEQTAYRQALRDITDQDGFPLVITWPTKPE